MLSVWVPVAHHFQIAALAHWYGGSAWCLSLSIPYLSAGCFAAHPNIGILSHCNPTARLLFQCTSQGCICGASQLVQEHQWLHIPCPSFLQLFKKRLDHTHTEWDIGGSYGLILLNHPPPHTIKCLVLSNLIGRSFLCSGLSRRWFSSFPNTLSRSVICSWLICSYSWSVCPLTIPSCSHLSRSLFVFSAKGIFLPETVESTSFKVPSLFRISFLCCLGTTNSPIVYSTASRLT